MSNRDLFLFPPHLIFEIFLFLKLLKRHIYIYTCMLIYIYTNIENGILRIKIYIDHLEKPTAGQLWRFSSASLSHIITLTHVPERVIFYGHLRDYLIPIDDPARSVAQGQFSRRDDHTHSLQWDRQQKLEAAAKLRSLPLDHPSQLGPPDIHPPKHTLPPHPPQTGPASSPTTLASPPRPTSLWHLPNFVF